MTNFDVDKHNFGRCVMPMERASGVWFKKPRPVFWEWLFFGKDSPLTEFFSAVGENGPGPLVKYLFNLEIELEDEWSGYSKKIETSSSRAVTPERLYSFGVLLGYSYIFGLRDLHNSNLVLTDTHLQAIDAEVVLTDLILPNESVLLPFKDSTFDRCGLRLLVNSVDALPEDGKGFIFAGYLDAFSSVYLNREKILLALEQQSLQAPVRMIVRNTRDYNRHVKGMALLSDLLPEEQAQLERGDVPYFFKLIGRDELFWISDSSRKPIVVKNLGQFKIDVNRHAVSPARLIGDPKVLAAKMAQGAFILQKLLVDGCKREFKWCGSTVAVGPGLFENHALNQVFKKKLAAPSPANPTFNRQFAY